jgi:hypothetical protein
MNPEFKKIKKTIGLVYQFLMDMLILIIIIFMVKLFIGMEHFFMKVVLIH